MYVCVRCVCGMRLFDVNVICHVLMFCVYAYDRCLCWCVCYVLYVICYMFYVYAHVYGICVCACSVLCLWLGVMCGCSLFMFYVYV